MLNLPFLSPLSASQKQSWETDGYLLLKGAVSATELTKISASVEKNWLHRENNPHHVDVITGAYAGQCFKMSDAPLEVRNESYKLNNLFLMDEAIRSVALSPYLRRVMQALLAAEPMICNSLNFERGSQQDAHIDSWYMPAPTDDGMVAASISLDTVDDTNGPIFFYPGSHKIPPYRFSDGRLNLINDEFEACKSYVKSEIEKRNLKLERLSSQPGDVFIWNGQMIHGGSPISDFARTRKSMVVHYWRATDVDEKSVRRDTKKRAYLGHTLRGELGSIAA